MKKFTENYYQPYHMNSIRRFAREKLKLTPKVRKLFKHVRELPKGSKVLDAGCGIGGLLELIERENPGVTTTGIDYGHPPEFRSKGDFARASIYQLPFPENHFDLITSSHVFEHLQDPFKALAELARVCKPGGMIYLETPSQRTLLLPFGVSFWDDPTHIRPYTQTALRVLFSEVGLEPYTTGVKKSLVGIIIGIPYLIYGWITSNEHARALLPAYLFGLHIYAMGKKPEAEP